MQNCRTGAIAGSAYTYSYATLGEFIAWIIAGPDY